MRSHDASESVSFNPPTENMLRDYRGRRRAALIAKLEVIVHAIDFCLWRICAVFATIAIVTIALKL